MEVTCTQIPVHYFENAGANSGYLLISFCPSGSCGRLKVREQPPVHMCMRGRGRNCVYGYGEHGSGTSGSLQVPRFGDFFRHQFRWSTGGPASTCPSVLNHAAVLGSLLCFACKLPRVAKIGSAKRSREPLGKLRSTGTLGQKPMEKVNEST